MTKELTALAPSTIKIRQVHNFRTDWTSLTFNFGTGWWFARHLHIFTHPKQRFI